MKLLSSQQVILAFTMTLSASLFTGCSHKDEQKTENQTAASAAEAAAPMTAAPAKESGAPAAITEGNAAVDAGPDAASASATGANTATASASEVAANEAVDGAADNSGMDKITENDQVIDNEPASPNAPRASEDSGEQPQQSKVVGNAKLGK